MKENRKLIEVSLPLESINYESSREKSIRHGHPSTIHLWWARRPLASCRSVLFSSIVDDPSGYILDEEEAKSERKRLFSIMEELVKWENSNNENVLNKARFEIAKSVARSNGDILSDDISPQEILRYLADNAPPVLDPFSGGGSIPLEAQRLGLKTYASDLNPVAVLITKALTEIPFNLRGKPPVNPKSKKQGMLSAEGWKGARGLAEDVRYYGKWMGEMAFSRIGHLYPSLPLADETQSQVIAWLWTRTIKCPNPACGAEMPLTKSFWLSRTKRKNAWVDYTISDDRKSVIFQTETGKGAPPDPPKMGRGAKFKCIVCDQPVTDSYIKKEGVEKRMGTKLLAIVGHGKSGRRYISPTKEHESISKGSQPKWKPDEELAHDPRAIWCTLYGLKNISDLHTDRQLTALSTFSDLVVEAREKCLEDTKRSGLFDNDITPEERVSETETYANAVATYLALAVDRLANRSSTLCIWNNSREGVEQTFGRQALSMTWDFAEANVFSNSTGSWSGSLEWIPKVLEMLPATAPSFVNQADATKKLLDVEKPIICTDPPYYDNIGYADLSDFFYVWMRHSLGGIYPSLFSTMLTPKEQELVASPYRNDGDWDKASSFFEKGLIEAFSNIYNSQNSSYPISLFYAFKQSESEVIAESGEKLVSSTGWETMLEGLIQSGLSITATWPIHTERDQGLKTGTNVLASSIVLVCRPRKVDAPIATHREIISLLRSELPNAIMELQEGAVAPVDLAQASIGPGMAVFSRYSKVLNADGAPMSIRAALQLINQELEAFLKHEEGEMDPETRFCISWFEQYGVRPGPYGEADVLARAKDTTVDVIAKTGSIISKAGKVNIKKRSEFTIDWFPSEDENVTLWNYTQHLIKHYLEDGETGAAEVVAKIGTAKGEEIKSLAYRLFDICEKKGWAEEGRAYNEFVTAWPEIQKKADNLTGSGPQRVFSFEKEDKD